MAQEPVERLSEGQREALRMVYRHMETKEIARVLGISPDGVAQRIKAAMRALGVSNRRAAARMLADFEAPETHRLLYEPETPDLEIKPSDLPTKTVRAPSGEVVRLKVVKSDSKTLGGDLLAAFRSSVRSIRHAQRRKSDEAPDPSEA